MHARQVLYHLNYISSPFCFSLFFRWVLVVLPGTGLGLWPSDLCLWVAGITGYVLPHPAFFFLWWYWKLSSGVALARQTLYYLSHTASSLCFGYSSDRVSLYAWAGLHCNSPIYASPYSWDDNWAPRHPVIGWDGVLETFCLGWPHTAILLISAK
jgi:hypothetical protein